MSKNVYEYVTQCKICKTTKASNTITRPEMGTTKFVERPFQKIYIDLLGPYPRSKSGKTVVLVVLDQLTKFPLLKSLTKGTTSSIINFLKNDVFTLFGCPEFIFSDNGSQFTSNEFREFLSKYQITHQRTPVYCPQSNASERVNRSVLSAVRSYIKNDHRMWDEHLSEIAAALRGAVHRSICYSPYFALFGYQMIHHAATYKLLRDTECLNEPDLEILPANVKLPIIHDKIKVNLQQAFNEYSKAYNLRTRPISYSEGQKVFIRTHFLSEKNKQFSSKLAPVYIPGIIVNRTGGVTYTVANDSGKILGVYHAKDLKL